jgi:hypothetical protein
MHPCEGDGRRLGKVHNFHRRVDYLQREGVQEEKSVLFLNDCGGRLAFNATKSKANEKNLEEVLRFWVNLPGCSLPYAQYGNSIFMRVVSEDSAFGAGVRGSSIIE